jgi:MFS family permease
MSPGRRLSFASWINALLASIMVACLAAAGSRIGQALAASSMPGLSGIPILVVAGSFLVAMEVQLTRRLLPQYLLFGRAWIRAVVMEWTCLLFSMVFLVWFAGGWEFTLGEIRAMPGDLLAVFQKWEYLAGFLVLLLSWGASRVLVTELIALEEEPFASPKEQVIDPFGDQVRARDRLWEHAFLFGAGVVLFSLIVPSIILSLHEGKALPQGAGWEVTVYFLCALVLLTIGRFLLLRADWTWERTPILPGLARRWIIYSLAFLALIILLVSILPTDYSFNLLTSLNRVVRGIIEAGMMIWALLYYYVIFPIVTFFSSLLSPLTGPAVSPVAPREEIPQMPELPILNGTWVISLREVLLWALILGLAVYVLREALHNRFSLLREALRRPVGKWLLKILHSIWKRLARLPRKAAEAVQSSLRNMVLELADRTGRLDFGIARLGDLSDQARIRFYFFALIHRGTERGFPRGPAQTPREYSGDLAAAHPLLQDGLQEMTAAFEEARYTRHAVDRAQVRRIRQVWDTIRSQLRKSEGREKPDGDRQA